MVFCSQPSEKANLSAIPVQKQNLVLITPRNHPLAGQDTIDLKETVSYPQIYFEKSAGIRSVIDQMFLNIGETPNIAYATEEDQVIAGLAAQGFGIAIVPYMDLLLKLDVKITPDLSHQTVNRCCLWSMTNVYLCRRQCRTFVSLYWREITIFEKN